jgi:F0F1-type ATP synthase membrane subunit c/vacuolar-type H+-ATPase subunit K
MRWKYAVVGFVAWLAVGIGTAMAQSPTLPITSILEGTGSLGVAKLVSTVEKDVKDGTVLSATNHGAEASSVPYDSQVLGVVARDAAIVLTAANTENGVPVIPYGQVYVLVSSQDGKITKGDMVTTSTIPGVAVVAKKSGYVLGTAMEDYTGSDPKRPELIAVDLNLHYFNSKTTFPGSLTDVFKIALLSTKDGPSALLKYLVAALVVIGSFVLGFMTFGRTAAKGVEALGRNPAAGKIISVGIVFNVTIVVAIVLAGLTVAFLILRL